MSTSSEDSHDLESPGRWFDFALVVWHFCKIQICWTLYWGTPGPTSFSKYIINLFSECFISGKDDYSTFTRVVIVVAKLNESRLNSAPNR